MDWSDLEKSLSDWNAGFGLAKGPTRDKYGPTTSTGHERGVHVGTEFRDTEKPYAGESDAGHALRNGSAGNRSEVIGEHKRVLSEARAMPKPKLPG